MSRLKVIIDAGVGVADAIKAALGVSVRDFAERNGLSESAVSAVINGSTPYPYEKIRDTLAQELGVERAYIDELLPKRTPDSAAESAVA